MKLLRVQLSIKVAGILFVFLSILIACQKSGKQVSEQEKNEYKEIKATKVTINFNQSFTIKEIKKGQSMSDIYISGTGFPNTTNILSYIKVAPLEAFYVADLDDNGFEELYLITRSVGTGSKAVIFGIASMNGKSYKSIFNPENESSFKEKLVYLEGYQGHDSIFFDHKKLYRQFPIDSNEPKTKSGHKSLRIITYRLVLYNNTYSLQVDSVINKDS